jgi:hypothetical protein
MVSVTDRHQSIMDTVAPLHPCYGRGGRLHEWRQVFAPSAQLPYLVSRAS